MAKNRNWIALPRPKLVILFALFSISFKSRAKKENNQTLQCKIKIVRFICLQFLEHRKRFAIHLFSCDKNQSVVWNRIRAQLLFQQHFEMEIKSNHRARRIDLHRLDATVSTCRVDIRLYSIDYLTDFIYIEIHQLPIILKRIFIQGIQTICAFHHLWPLL